jgi:hypothetical protein
MNLIGPFTAHEVAAVCATVLADPRVTDRRILRLIRDAGGEVLAMTGPPEAPGRGDMLWLRHDGGRWVVEGHGEWHASE